MFCYKCGSKMSDGAAFCPQCGAKQTVEEVVPKAEATTEKTSKQQELQSELHAEKDSRTARTQTTDRKKRSKKRSLVLGAIAVLLLVVVGAGLLSAEEEPSLFQLAEEIAPLTDLGFETTYGEFFEWLIADTGTSFEQDGDVAYLTYSGTVTGGDYPVSIVLKVSGLSVNAETQWVEPYSMTLNGKAVLDFDDPEGMLMELFWGAKNQQDFKTFMDYVHWDNENGFDTFKEYLDDSTWGTGSLDAVQSMDEAQRLIEDWLAEHPIGGDPSLGVAPANDVASVSAEYFVFDLWHSPRDFLGLVSVRKADGYMEFESDLYARGSLDEWYRTWYEGEQDGGVTYNGISITNLIGCAPVELYDYFGSPVSGTPVDGDMYNGGEYYGYEGVLFVIDYATSKVNWIVGNPKAVEFSGYSLNRNRDELIALLGVPVSEEEVYDDMEDTSSFVMQYIIDGATISLQMADASAVATSFTIW